MPRKSGAFKYIELCITDGSLINITSWPAKILESRELRRYCMLRNPELKMEPNPFASLNYKLDNRRDHHAAHLSFFEEFYSDNSLLATRRNLSYCHGTEYFISCQHGDARERITVHYHFNLSGRYLHTTAKNESGERIEITPQQESIFRERALQYQTEFQKILEKKYLRYLELAKAVESGNDRIMQDVMQGNIKKPQLLAKIRDQAKINQLKDSIGDMKKDSSASMRMFERIIIQTNEQAAAKDDLIVPPSQELLLEQSSLDERKSQTNTISKDREKKMPKANVSYAAEVSELEKELHNLQLEFKLITHKSSEQQVAEYLNNHITLRTKLLILSMNLQRKNEIKKLQFLLKQMALLETPEEIFEKAIQNLNLAHVQASFEFCAHNVSYRIFSDLIDAWSMAAKKHDNEREGKIQAIAEFFSENSDSFAAFIKDRSQMIPLPIDSDCGFSMLGTAFVCGSKNMFVAFLDFGVDLYVPWLVYKNGESSDALAMIMKSDRDDDFYMEQLMAHGLQFSRRGDARTAQALKASVATRQSIIRRRVDKDLDKLAATGEKMGKKIVTLENRSENHESKKTITCAFIFLNNDIERYKSNLLIYSSFAKYCPLSSLLFSASILVEDSSINIYSVPSSKTPGLNLIDDPDKEVFMVMGLGHPSCPKNICNLLDISHEVADSAVVRGLTIICDAIRTRFPAPLTADDLENTLAELQGYARNLNLSKNYELAATCFVAIIFLFGLKGDLSPADSLKCIGVWHDAALAKLQCTQALKEILSNKLQEDRSKKSDLIKGFGGMIESSFKKANAYFVYAIQLAYYSPYPLLTSDPIVLDCHSRNFHITNNLIYSAEVKQELQATYRTIQQWQEARDQILNVDEEEVPSPTVLSKKESSDITIYPALNYKF